MKKSKPAVFKERFESKKHGAKRRMWHYTNKQGRTMLGMAGMCTKYNDEQSFYLALTARKVAIAPFRAQWIAFRVLPDRAKQDAYFASVDRRKK